MLVDKQKIPILMEHSLHEMFHILNPFTNFYTEDKALDVGIFQANIHLCVQ